MSAGWKEPNLTLDESFENISKMYRSGLLAYVRALLRYDQRHDAEGIVQDTFVKLLENPALPTDAIRSWLYTTAGNRCIDFHRRANRNRSESLDDIQQIDIDPRFADKRPSEDEERSIQARQDVFFDILKDFLDRDCEEWESSIFRLWKIEGRTPSEIASIVGMDPERVRKTCYRLSTEIKNKEKKEFKKRMAATV